MAKTLKVIELLAESDHSWEDAATVAVERARKTLRHIRSVYVENLMRWSQPERSRPIGSMLKSPSIWSRTRLSLSWSQSSGKALSQLP